MSKSEAKKQREFDAMVARCVASSEARRRSRIEQERWRESYVASMREGDRELPKLSNNITGPCFRKSIDDTKWKRVYSDESLVERERQAQKEVDHKRKMVAPAYNKGATQYIGSKDDWKTAGRKV